MAKISILGEKTTKKEAFSSLDEFVVREKLLAEVVRSELLNLRLGNAHTKNRGEVRGGGKKPWRQKGTGRARHGSTRSPIWVGGGVNFGPRNIRNWKRKINKNAKTTALKSIIKDRLTDEAVFQLNDSFVADKTKDTENFVSKIVEKSTANKPQSVLMVYTTEDKLKIRGFLNTGVKMINAKHLQIHKFVQSAAVLLTPNATKELEAKTN